VLAVYKPDEITSSDFDEARGIVKAGLASLEGKEPELKVIALVLAKITLESGRSGMTLLTSCHDGNVGNVKASFDYEGMFTLYPCNEILDGHAVWFRPEGRLDHKGGAVVSERYLLPPAGDGHPQCRFRAYANVVDGIYEYLDFIWREKYRDARAALLSGDPHAYVHALKLKGYFTADEEVYGRGVAGLHAEFLARLEGRVAPLMPAPDVTHLLAPQPFNATAVTASLNAAFAAREQQIVEESFSPDNFQEDEPDTAVIPKGQGNA
jgi:hypothetical protein